MERIQELLAKGIENLTDDELTELRTALVDRANEIIDESGSAPTDEDATELEAIANSLDSAKAETKNRKAAADARAQKVADIAARVSADDEDENADEATTEPAAETDPEVDPADAEVLEPVASGETAPTTTPEPVAASGVEVGPRPVVTHLAARRPATARPRVETRPAPITAAAGVPGIVAGAKLDDPKIARAFEVAARSWANSEAAFKMPVITASIEYPEARQLDADAWGNDRKIKAVTSPEAIVASGGVCAPVPYRYDLPIVGTDARPVRDALSRFGAQRGGVRTLKPPTITDVTGAVGQWTMANDETPSNPTTKPYLTIGCDATEYSTDVYAITQSFKVGNFRQRWDADRVQAFLDLAATWTARYAESLLLKTIATGSKAVTHGQVLGTSTDLFTGLRQLFAGIRYRHRMERNVMLRAILPDWIRDNALVDIARLSGDGGTHEERMVRAEATLDTWFHAVGVNPSWHLDYENGRSVGQAGGPFGGTQGVGSLIGWPDKARVYVFIEGSWLFLDGGSLDFGITRDATLIGTNDMLMFAEFMENAHYHGVPGESYAVDFDICANGGYASPLDIAPCVSGS